MTEYGGEGDDEGDNHQAEEGECPPVPIVEEAIRDKTLILATWVHVRQGASEPECDLYSSSGENPEERRCN